MTLGLLLVIGVLVVLKYAEIAKVLGFVHRVKAAGPPPEVVGTFVAENQTWSDTLSAVGNITSSRGVDISNDAPGIVSRIDFDSGDEVTAGKVLVELDTSVERAQLAEARAHLRLARSNAERTRQLVASGALPKQQGEVDESQFAAASADVRAIQAQIERKIVRAPFAGKLGIRLVNVGQYLAPGTPITQLESERGTFVDFTLPQKYVGKIAVGMPVHLTVGGGNGGQPASGKSVDGTVYAVEPSVNPTTRNLSVRATVPEDQGFRPGMFVNVSVTQGKATTVVAIPATAVVHAPYGDSVFIVENDKGEKEGQTQTQEGGKPSKVARQQFVRVGRMHGDFVAIDEGVKVGEQVVTAGAFKLRNGAPVTVNNSVKPRPELSPHPENG